MFAMLALAVFDKEDDEASGGPSRMAYVLMPLIDAFNHVTMPKTEFEFNNDR